jgi:hypothetical protein
VDITIIAMQADLRSTASSAAEIQENLPVLEDISFQNIRTWRITSKIDILASLNLNNATDIVFRSIDSMNRFFAPIPIQLTDLELSQVSFTIKSLPGGQRYSLPCLTSLALEDVVVFGSLSDYFHCPKLNNLDYVINSPSARYNVAPIQETFDEVFCRESRGLKLMGLEGVIMTDALVRSLASFPNLCALQVQDCHPDEFIPPFLERLQDPKYLPRLKWIRMEKSWSFPLELPYEEFAAQCNSSRPGVHVIGSV